MRKESILRKANLLCQMLLFAIIPTTVTLADGEQPNIVVILADDLGWGDVGWHDSEIPTPNLDKLAFGGARLEQFYVQPVCTPTRAAFLTGRYPIRHGLQSGVIRPWAQYGLPLEEQTLADGLRSNGYATAIVGKWHLGHFEQAYLPTNRGFDHQYGHYNGAIDYNTHERDGGFDWHKDDQVNRDEGYSTHLIAKEAVRLVETYGGKKPLFLYVPFNAVHSPHQVPNQYLESFPHLTGQRKIYAGMLTALDEAVGKIVGAIDDVGIRKNTLILFSSDNGGPQPGTITSNGNLRAGKATHYDGGVRVAAFANWEGKIAAGGLVDKPIHITDLYPTLLNIAGAKVQQKLPLDGVDVWESISGNQPSARKEILINATPLSGAIRIDDWKLVVNGEQATAGFDGEAVVDSAKTNVELFDLKNDPYEKQNLAKDNPEVVQRLLKRWSELRDQAIPPKTRPKTPSFQSPAVWGDKVSAKSKTE
jgi:arylsulfatase A-like enzyme